jgi:hypothetical protein
VAHSSAHRLGCSKDRPPGGHRPIRGRHPGMSVRSRLSREASATALSLGAPALGVARFGGLLGGFVQGAGSMPRRHARCLHITRATKLQHEGVRVNWVGAKSRARATVHENARVGNTSQAPDLSKPGWLSSLLLCHLIPRASPAASEGSSFIAARSVQGSAPAGVLVRWSLKVELQKPFRCRLACGPRSRRVNEPRRMSSPRIEPWPPGRAYSR